MMLVWYISPSISKKIHNDSCGILAGLISAFRNAEGSSNNETSCKLVTGCLVSAGVLQRLVILDNGALLPSVCLRSWIS